MNSSPKSRGEIQLVDVHYAMQKISGSRMKVHRWVKRKILPEPTQIAGRNYWNKKTFDSAVSSQMTRPRDHK